MDIFRILAFAVTHGGLAAMRYALLLLQVELHHSALLIGVVVAKDILDR